MEILKSLNRFLMGMSFFLLAGCNTAAPVSQTSDVEYMPEVATPAYIAAGQPVVLVDAAHGNFHTIDGRFRAFAKLLEADGCIVRSAEKKVTRDLLDEADVYVISNAGSDVKWELPAIPAFTGEEISSIRGWVEDGGALFLIADHMPMPGATADLAAAFGIIFYNGFAMPKDDIDTAFTMRRDDATLADHPITRGRNQSEQIEWVMTFTGQAFRIVPGVPGVDPLLYVPANVEILFPTKAWEFSEQTPRVAADGMLQGAVLRVGKGRVAVFGEAAMFTAQSQTNDGQISWFGMNDPDAKDNEQFVLNVIHWLTGLLDP